MARLADIQAATAVILAGGAGTRLWPLSRSATPKHLLRLIGDKTLLRATYERARLVAGRVLVVTEASQLNACMAELPELGAGAFIAEPARRGTAACLAIAAAGLDPEGVMISLHADHLIADDAGFAAAGGAALEWAAETGSLVTLGLRPTHPATGFGYIECGEELTAGSRLPAYRALRFVEKPAAGVAEAMVADGRHLWNLGIFAWRNRVFLEQLGVTAPDIAAGAAAAARARAEGREQDYSAAYTALREAAVDHAVMEQTTDLLVVPAAFAWSDLGSWSDLAEALPADEHGNIADAGAVLVDASDNLVVAAGRVVALVGVSGLAVVDAGDAILIVPRARAQEVKQVVAELKRRGRTDLL